MGEQLRRARLVETVSGLSDAEIIDLLECYRRDPIQWLSDWGWGYDDRLPLQGRPGLQPFVPFWWQVSLFLCLCGGVRTITRKYRGAGWSYLLIFSQLWGWSILGRSYGLASTEGGHVFDGTTDSLLGKAEHALRHIHQRLLPRGWRLKSTPHPTIGAPGLQATILGRRTTLDAWHGPRRASIGVDECARVPRLDLVMLGVDGATDAPQLGSTPFGPRGRYYEMWSGKAGAVVDIAPSDLPKTLAQAEQLRRDLAGAYARIDLRLEDDVRYPPERVDAIRRSMTPEAFAEQYGGDFLASVPGRIWPEFREVVHVYDDAAWRELLLGGWLHRCRVIESWDTGLYTAVLWIAVDDEDGVATVIDWRGWHAATADQIAEELASARSELAPLGWRTAHNPRGRLPDLRVGDPAVRARTGPEARSWLGAMREQGVEIESRSIIGRIGEMQDRVRLALRHERLFLGPSCRVDHGGQPSLVDAVASYRRVVKGEAEQAVADKGAASHAADALQYGLDWAWGDRVDCAWMVRDADDTGWVRRG